MITTTALGLRIVLACHVVLWCLRDVWAATNRGGALTRRTRAHRATGDTCPPSRPDEWCDSRERPAPHASPWSSVTGTCGGVALCQVSGVLVILDDHLDPCTGVRSGLHGSRTLEDARNIAGTKVPRVDIAATSLSPRDAGPGSW